MEEKSKWGFCSKCETELTNRGVARNTKGVYNDIGCPKCDKSVKKVYAKNQD